MKTSLVSLTLITLLGCSTRVEQPNPRKDSSTQNPPKITKPDTIKEVGTGLATSKPVIMIRPNDYQNCGLSSAAQELAELIATSAEQQRPKIVCDIRLSKLAQAKAEEMANLGVVSHKGAYSSPNKRLIQNGIRLSESEKDLFNSVEAVMGGEEFADEVWLSFQASYAHRTHLLADNPIFEGQESMGVGYFRKLQSPHVDYWVVYFANLSK